ncbi:unnamed protein product [Natator depressus]
MTLGTRTGAPGSGSSRLYARRPQPGRGAAQRPTRLRQLSVEFEPRAFGVKGYLSEDNISGKVSPGLFIFEQGRTQEDWLSRNYCPRHLIHFIILFSCLTGSWKPSPFLYI